MEFICLANLATFLLIRKVRYAQEVFDRSLVEAVQGIALSSTFCVPFAQILEYFIMFSFQALTCFRIVSIQIIFILYKFRHVSEQV